MRIYQPLLTPLSFRRCPVVVYKSASANVFENIALEDYIYTSKPPDQRILLIWRNSPCVVLGRHQNPWLEINLKETSLKHLAICRRNSGGGTVYHDYGNINLTFFTHRDNYNRKENLDFIIDVFRNKFSIDLSRNAKDDLLLGNVYKVSGTAAKLGLKSAYHHCTLLCQSDLNNLHRYLFNPFGGFNTNATKSIPSKTKNIFDMNDFDYSTVSNMMGEQYYGRYDNKSERIHEIYPNSIKEVKEKVELFSSWEWIYAKSPKFTYKGDIILENEASLKYQLNIAKGTICEVQIQERAFSSSEPLLRILNGMIGLKFSKIPIQDYLSMRSDDRTYTQHIIKSLPF